MCVDMSLTIARCTIAWKKSWYFNQKLEDIYEAKKKKKASVGNQTNYCYEVINEKEDVPDTNSGYVFGAQISYLEYQQCGEQFQI